MAHGNGAVNKENVLYTLSSTDYQILRNYYTFHVSRLPLILPMAWLMMPLKRPWSGQQRSISISIED